jgi:hypothetical protein
MLCKCCFWVEMRLKFEDGILSIQSVFGRNGVLLNRSLAKRMGNRHRRLSSVFYFLRSARMDWRRWAAGTTCRRTRTCTSCAPSASSWPPTDRRTPSTSRPAPSGGKITYVHMMQSFFRFKNYHPVPWRDSISRPIAPVSSVAGGDYTSRPHRQGNVYVERSLPIEYTFNPPPNW